MNIVMVSSLNKITQSNNFLKLSEKLKEKFAKKNIPVEVIDSTAYGLCDAESILEQAKNMKKGE